MVWIAITKLAGSTDLQNARVVIPYKFVSYIGIGLNSITLIPLLVFRGLGVPIF